jgi:hypothetical protein
VWRVDPLAGQIVSAARAQLDRGRYAPSQLYGDGHVSERIAEALASLTPYVQKRLGYVDENEESIALNEAALCAL